MPRIPIKVRTSNRPRKIITKILYRIRCSSSFSKTCHNQTKNYRNRTSLLCHNLLLPSRSSTNSLKSSKTSIRIFNRALLSILNSKWFKIKPMVETSSSLKMLNCSKHLRISLCLQTVLDQKKWAMIGLMVPLKTIIWVNTTHSSHLCKIVAIETGNQTILTSTITERTLFIKTGPTSKPTKRP